MLQQEAETLARTPQSKSQARKAYKGAGDLFAAPEIHHMSKACTAALQCYRSAEAFDSAAGVCINLCRPPRYAKQLLGRPLTHAQI